MQDILLAVVCERLWMASGCVGVVFGVVEGRGSELLLASIVGQAAGIVAEPLVTSALAALWMGTSQRDYPPAMLAAFEFSGGSHKPVHLQVHGPQQVIEFPSSPQRHR